ncbi:MAG: aldehyde dehydrogenase family protein [Opitutaceae bacterium]|nr:aldehyde dehydrogenase family protein [Opitutaceae bacterium]
MNTGADGALILVDLQQDFLTRPGMEPHAATVVAGAAGWLAVWRAAGRPIAHVLTRVSREPDRRMAHWKKSGLWACEQGTPGERTPDVLGPREGEAVFYKEGYLPTAPEEVINWVRETGASRAVLAGVMTHACVANLAAAVLSAGLEVAWAAGALGSDRPQAAAQVLAHFASKGVREFGEPMVANDTVTSAVAAARAAWAGSTADWTATRAALLRWADMLEGAAAELGPEITVAVGKPITMARDEVRYAAASVRDVVRWRDEFKGERRAQAGVAARRALGVVAVLTPWNNPVSIPVGRLAPALAYGNAVVWKPAPAVEGISRRLQELALHAGLNGELLQLSEGGAEEGRRLVWNPQVDAITFSGSLARGRLVLAAGAERLIPCQLEMGGNNAAVVADDADAETAADAVLAGAFGFAGQRCTANRRVILLPGVREAFLRRARERLADWVPGDPFDEACRIGPVKDVAAVVRIEAVLVRAATAGARVTRVGTVTGPRNVAPALVEGAAEDAEIVREETFGPVLVVQEARDWADALRLLNAVPQGLVAALFAKSDESWEKFKAAANAGVLRRNNATAGALDGLPFGGWKASAWGGAEHAEADALFFTRHQTWIQS